VFVSTHGSNLLMIWALEFEMGIQSHTLIGQYIF
jgi:hypothetical protein